MCGITGAIWTEPRLGITADQLARMTDVIRHRGPDDEGAYRSEYLHRSPYEPMPGIALGFRRLAIIDLATGNQPLANEDESVWLVFNGEIYNYVALRHRLEGAGHQFRTQGDAETILHLYEDEGLECFSHLNGMFAVAIWDSRERRLVLARDRLGQKPLVYRHEPGRLLFASELKSLLQVPGIPRQLDPAALDAYLTYQYVPHPRTIFQGIQKVPPGHFVVARDDHLSVEPYWQPDFRQERIGREAEAREELRHLLQDSVALRMQSEVPLGAFLSGGVDSSLIVALMQQGAHGKAQTFSIGFPVAEYDEREYARTVAQHLDTDHHEFEVTPDGVEILPRLVWHYDEPFADSSAIPTWYVSQLTRQHVTVCLSGDGGDELFLGYPRYRAVSLAQRIDQWPWLKSCLGAEIWQKLPAPARQKSKWRQCQRFLEAIGKTPLARYLDWISIFNESRRAELYREDYLETLPNEDPAHFLGAAWRRFERRDPLTVAGLGDLVTYLPGDLNCKVDIASMAHSLECRQPFLDHRLVEFAASLPSRWKFRGGKGKQILKQTFRDLLPSSIFQRPKMGFGVPLDHWFRNELREMTHDVLLCENPHISAFFRTDTLQAWVQQHEDGVFNHSYRLWALLFLELWYREWCA